MNSETTRFIFIGDTHGFVNDFIKQKEIIEKVNPKIILSENMQNISLITEKDYIKIIQRKEISAMVNFDEMEPLIKLCYKKKIKLIGIDFPNFGFNEKLQKIVKGELKPINKDIKELNKIIKMRQKKHLKILKKFEKESEKPILVLIGAWHLRENSLIMKSLKNYKVIFPCDKNDKILIKPSKAGDVHYCVRVKNG
jgi:uncharacterized iron-regulated protein